MAEQTILDFLEKNLLKLDGGATYLGTFERIPNNGLFTSQLTNRPSKSWPKAQFLYTTVDSQGHSLEECLENWQLMCGGYRNQYLIIKDADGTNSLYDYNSELLAIGNEIETEIARIANICLESNTDDEPLQLIYYGAPGTGKSFKIDKRTNENNSVRITFHPDSDYASFVGAYKPTMAPMPINAFVGTTVHHAKNAENEKAFEKKIVYKYVPQAFLKAYVEAWKRYSPNVDNPYYLVIEEINRGNCAQIFGDLFQLLDRNSTGSSSYAISADEDIAQFLRDDEKGFASLSDDQKSAIRGFELKKDSGSIELIGPSILDGSKLLLPPNLRIWATMNTSDQSLFPIDSAFKRRWNWEYMPIEYDKKDWTFLVGDKRYRWGDFLKEINPKIFKLTQSEDKQIGYFFAKPDKKSKDDLTENDTISTKVFVNKVLFYLWTDVFKDYDLTEDPFVYEDEEGKKIAYRFTDFFSTNGADMLTRFIDGFGLTVVGEQEDVKDETEDGKKISPNGFKVNGGKADTITWSLHQILKPVVGNMSFEQISSKIKEFIPRDTEVFKTIDNPENYTKENGWLRHYLTTSDGVSFVITNQWKKEFIPMVKALADNLGIEFEQI